MPAGGQAHCRHGQWVGRCEHCTELSSLQIKLHRIKRIYETTQPYSGDSLEDLYRHTAKEMYKEAK